MEHIGDFINDVLESVKERALQARERGLRIQLSMLADNIREITPESYTVHVNTNQRRITITPKDEG